MKILLIGDYCIDVYQYGDVSRISPESPVPIFDFSYQEEKEGMSGNVKNNFLNLGVDVDFYGGKPSIKTRLIDNKVKKQLLRIDQDSKSDVFDNQINYETYDAVVISDYCKGFISYEVIETIRKQYNGPIFVDSKKKDLKRFQGCIVKINEQEYINRISNCSELIVTLGSKGVIYKDKKYKSQKIEMVDVCGAGDTFLASLVYDYLKFNDIEHAIEYAIRAASITVQHFGVYAPTLEEINET